MYFTKGKQRAFELLMQQKPGFDRYQSGCAGDDEDCGTCRFYRPGWKYEFCVFKECPYCPGKGRGKRPPAWTNRRAKALVPCGFADAKTAKGILQYQNSRKRLSNCPRIPREEVRKYGSFQSGAKYGYTVMSNHHLRNKELSLKAKGLVVANAVLAGRLGLYPCGLIPYQPGEDRRNPRSGKGTRKKPDISCAAGSATKRDACGAQITSYTSSRSRESRKQLPAADSRLYWIYLHWKIQHWIIQRWKNLRRKKPTLENPTQLNKDISSKEQSITDLSSTHSIPFHSLNPCPLSRAKRLRRRKGKERKRKAIAQ